MRPLTFSIAAAAVITAVVLIADVDSYDYGANKPNQLTQDSICSGENQCIKPVCYKDRNRVQTVHLACAPNAVLSVNDIVLAKFNNSCPSGCCTPFNYMRDCLTPLKNHSPQLNATRLACNGQSQCSFQAIQVHVSFVNCQGKASTVEPSDYVIINYKCYMNMTSTTSTQSTTVSTSQDSSTNAPYPLTHSIVTVAVGALLILIIVILTTILCRRKRKSRAPSANGGRISATGAARGRAPSASANFYDEPTPIILSPVSPDLSAYSSPFDWDNINTCSAQILVGNNKSLQHFYLPMQGNRTHAVHQPSVCYVSEDSLNGEPLPLPPPPPPDLIASRPMAEYLDPVPTLSRTNSRSQVVQSQLIPVHGPSHRGNSALELHLCLQPTRTSNRQLSGFDCVDGPVPPRVAQTPRPVVDMASFKPNNKQTPSRMRGRPVSMQFIDRKAETPESQQYEEIPADFFDTLPSRLPVAERYRYRPPAPPPPVATPPTATPVSAPRRMTFTVSHTRRQCESADNILLNAANRFSSGRWDEQTPTPAISSPDASPVNVTEEVVSRMVRKESYDQDDDIIVIENDLYSRCQGNFADQQLTP